MLANSAFVMNSVIMFSINMLLVLGGRKALGGNECVVGAVLVGRYVLYVV